MRPFAATDPSPASDIDGPAVLTRLGLQPARVLGAVDTDEVAFLLTIRCGAGRAAAHDRCPRRRRAWRSSVRCRPEIQPPLVYAASVTRLARRPNPQDFVAFLATPGGDCIADRRRPGDDRMTPIYDEQRHPLSRRIAHWVMALSILVMIGSGWRIYNASPIFAFSFPEWATLGGDVEASLARHGDPGVATAIAWHFAAMWLLVASYLLFVLWGVAVRPFPARLPAGRPALVPARPDRRAALPARASAGRIQRRAEGRLLGRAGRGRGDDRLGHRDLEAGADLSAGDSCSAASRARAWCTSSAWPASCCFSWCMSRS